MIKMNNVTSVVTAFTAKVNRSQCICPAKIAKILNSRKNTEVSENLLVEHLVISCKLCNFAMLCLDS